MSSSSSKNGSYSSSGSSRDCGLGDPPMLNPPRHCLTVATSCGVINALGHRPSCGLLLFKPTPRSSSSFASDSCPLVVPDDWMKTSVVSASTLTMRYPSAVPSTRTDLRHSSLLRYLTSSLILLTCSYRLECPFRHSIPCFPIPRILVALDISLANHIPFCPKVRSLTSPGGPLERPFDRAEAAFAACNPVENRARGVSALPINKSESPWQPPLLLVYGSFTQRLLSHLIHALSDRCCGLVPGNKLRVRFPETPLSERLPK
ncbi:hypothetical protein OUZ56_018575 [Daphnia magna]|uniref:Uncharacterized protein n=1 Tax=Daphnia magna TaxID=35525 RepID=A0ABQ9Z9A1_9CRUS|nr:hypothetical protein OUZ56_018575 [Daphnia magna]